MLSTRRIANPIAVRRFAVVGEPGREVVLTIGKPRPAQGRWACSILIEGVPEPRRRRGRGTDAVQALQDALLCARRELDASGLPLTWVDEGEPGDLGLPLSAPIGYGIYVQHRIERYIERQVTEMATSITAILQERARRRAARGAPGA